MSKKARKELIVKISQILRAGIKNGDKAQIVEAYRWMEDLLADHGVFVLDDALPQFPEEITTIAKAQAARGSV